MSDPRGIQAVQSTEHGPTTSAPDNAYSASAATITSGPLPAGAAMTLGLLVFSTFVVVLTETIMSVALASLMEDLGIVAATAQWSTTGYLLTMAIVIPATGYLLQRFTNPGVDDDPPVPDDQRGADHRMNLPASTEPISRSKPSPTARFESEFQEGPTSCVPSGTRASADPRYCASLTCPSPNPVHARSAWL